MTKAQNLQSSVIERPMLMCGDMVRATLEDRKTKTRRFINPQPMFYHDVKSCQVIEGFIHYIDSKGTSHVGGKMCPYGKVGDRIWVKETFQYTDASLNIEPGWVYRATDRDWETLEDWKWKPSIFMPRKASRITLEITDIRVERLLEINQADCLAEGIESSVINADKRDTTYRDYMQKVVDPFEWYASPIDSYKSLWESINGVGSWSDNPWVWVITFKRLKPETLNRQ